MTVKLPREVKSVEWTHHGHVAEMTLRYRGVIGLVVWVRRRIRRALGLR